MGHVVRRQLLHQVREEYERTAQEIRTGSCLPLANQVVHWPKKNALCYPVFNDRVEEISEHHVHGYCGREGNKSSALSNTSSPGRDELSNTEPPIACDGKAEFQPTLTESGHGLQIRAAAKHTSASVVLFGSPPQSSLSTLLDSQGECRLVFNPDQRETSSLPSTTVNSSSINDQFAKQPPLVQDRSPHIIPSVPLPCITTAADSQPHLKSGVPQLEGDTVDESWLGSFRPTVSDLPQDRESLMELRAQLAVELLWIKQAIASRQNVSDFLVGVYLIITLNVAPMNFNQYSVRN